MRRVEVHFALEDEAFALDMADDDEGGGVEALVGALEATDAADAQRELQFFDSDRRGTVQRLAPR